MSFGQIYEKMKEERDAIPIALETVRDSVGVQPEVNPSAHRILREGEKIIAISRQNPARDLQ